MGENVRGKYRDLPLGGWHSFADALKEGENAEAALWTWLFKSQEAMDLVVGDLDIAGIVERESPPYVVAYDSFDLARYAWATAGTADDRKRWNDVPEDDRAALEKTMNIYRRIGEYLGEIRVDVLGELADLGGQRYGPIDLTPTAGTYHGQTNTATCEEEDLSAGTFSGQTLDDSLNLHFKAIGETDEWGIHFEADPETCRDMAMQLFRMAADAEHSEEVNL